MPRRFLSSRVKIDYRPHFSVKCVYPTTAKTLDIQAATAEDAMRRAIMLTSKRTLTLPLKLLVTARPIGSIGL